jgi:predicted lipoprotein with Yx(FWY)xxD motif
VSRGFEGSAALESGARYLQETNSIPTKGVPKLDKQWLAFRLLGAGLLLTTGAIHLDLYLTGYRTIPTIGWLFLLQFITAFAFGAVLIVSRSRVVAAGGGGFSVATLCGYLLSMHMSLFGFREVRTTAGLVAGIIEVATVAALAAVALRPVASRQRIEFATYGYFSGRAQQLFPAGRWSAMAITVVLAVALGLSLAATSPASTASKSSLRISTIHGASVLTDSSGYTLYLFAPDASGKSTCYGTCAVYWPPVLGPVTASEGIPGKLGTIERRGGAMQVTYDGHPLYTYVGDSAPGQATGNDIDLNGGYWYEMTASGKR